MTSRVPCFNWGRPNSSCSQEENRQIHRIKKWIAEKGDKKVKVKKGVKEANRLIHHCPLAQLMTEVGCVVPCRIPTYGLWVRSDSSTRAKDAEKGLNLKFFFRKSKK